MLEPTSIVDLSAIESEGFFIEVSEQMERLNVDVGAPNGPFQEAPEVLKAIGMNLAPDVCFSVVNDFMDVIGRQIPG